MLTVELVEICVPSRPLQTSVKTVWPTIAFEGWLPAAPVQRVAPLPVTVQEETFSAPQEILLVEPDLTRSGLTCHEVMVGDALPPCPAASPPEY